MGFADATASASDPHTGSDETSSRSANSLWLQWFSEVVTSAVVEVAALCQIPRLNGPSSINQTVFGHHDALILVKTIGRSWKDL